MAVDIAATITATFQSLRVLRDLVEANRSFRNFNELSGAVAEVYAKLIDAQTAALIAQQEQLTLTKHVGELEKENMKLKDWKRKAKRYQLTALTVGVSAYSLKPGMERGETPHYLCTNCFDKGEESKLQADAAGPQVYTYYCPRCQNKFPVASRPMTAPLLRV